MFEGEGGPQGAASPRASARERLISKAYEVTRRFFTGATQSIALSETSSIKDALNGCRRYFGLAAVFSGCINILMLSGSLFMLQVYDRVMPSHSVPTLQALLVLIVVLYAFTVLLESTRSRLFARIGRHFDVSLRKAVFSVNLTAALPGRLSPDASTAPLRDLDQIRTFLAGGRTIRLVRSALDAALRNSPVPAASADGRLVHDGHGRAGRRYLAERARDVGATEGVFPGRPAGCRLGRSHAAGGRDRGTAGYGRQYAAAMGREE